MNSSDLDLLDAAVAALELSLMARPDAATGIGDAGLSTCRATRDPEQILHLIEKHIARIVHGENGWAVVGLNGRASIGPTLSIAVCRAVLDSVDSRVNGTLKPLGRG